MSNILISFPNRSDSGTLSAGTWQAALPLANLQNTQLAKVARSTAATLASTKFDCDLGSDLYLRVVALPGTTQLTRAAKWRIRGSNDASFGSSVYDSGWIDIYPVIYPTGVLNFGDPGFFDGKLAAVDYTAGYRVQPVHILTTISTSRYWRIELDDTTNGDGYVEIGRLFMGYAYQPTINMKTGYSFGWQTTSSSTETDGGAVFHDDRARRRLVEFVLAQETTDEALVRGFEATRQLGTAGQFFVVTDPDDTEHLHRRAFLGTLKELSPLRFPYSSRADQAWAVVEEL